VKLFATMKGGTYYLQATDHAIFLLRVTILQAEIYHETWFRAIPPLDCELQTHGKILFWCYYSL